MWTANTSMSKHVLLILLCASFKLSVIGEISRLDVSSKFKLTQDVYNYCPLTNFKNRDIPNLSLRDGQIPCCGDCLTTSDCGYKQPCCIDTDHDITDKHTSCKYPAYIGNGTIEGSNIILTGKPRTSAMWMIDTCASDYADTHIETKCKTIHPNTLDDFTDIIPVIDIETSIIYYNRHCAVCNGIQDKNINTTFFQVQFKCKERMNVLLTSSALSRVDLLNENNCVYVFRETVPALVRNSVCYVPIDVHKCNQTGLWRLYDPNIVNACDSYTLTFYNTEVTRAHKNVHCYICNTNLRDNVFRYPKPNKPTCNLFPDGVSPTTKPTLTYSFYAIFDTEREQSKPKEELYCLVTHFYDPYQDMCRSYSCPALFEMTDRGCVEVFTSYNELYWSVSLALSLESYSATEGLESEQLASELIQYMKSALIGNDDTTLSKTCFEEVYMNNKSDIRDFENSEQDFNTSDIDFNYSDIDFDNCVVVANFGWQSRNTISILSRDVINFLKKYEGDDKKLTIHIGKAVLTFRASLFDRQKLGIEFNPRYISRPEVMVYNQSLSPKHWYHAAGDGNCKFCTTASQVMLCEKVMLNESEYESIDGTVRLVTNGSVLSETEYISHTGEHIGKITVCVDDYLYQQNSAILNKATSKTVYEKITVYASLLLFLYRQWENWFLYY